MPWVVYMLRCCDGSLYTGCTSDLKRRLSAHQRGAGAKYTQSRLPVELAWWEEAEGKSAALRREAAVKRLTHAQKAALTDGFHSMAEQPEYSLRGNTAGSKLETGIIK